MSKRFKCMIVDDEPLAASLIGKHVEKLPQLELQATCWNALDAFEIIRTQPVDLLFLDIQMPVLDGIDFVKSLPHPPAIIFTTAYREYAVESYELDVVDYLLKPITFDRFFKAINKFLDRHQPQATIVEPKIVAEKVSPFFFVNVNRKFVKIELETISHIESLKDYVKIHTLDKSVVTRDKISDLEQKLPDYFLRVHRSFIVNLKKITAYNAHDIEIGKVEIPMGISYKQLVLERFKSWQTNL